MNELDNFITEKRRKLVQKLQSELDRILDLHKSGCLLDRDNLSSKQVYDEMSIHAWAHENATSSLAKYLMTSYYRRGMPHEPQVIKEQLKKVYLPRAKIICKEYFTKKYSAYLSNDFFQDLPCVADYSGIKYLSYYLPINDLPTIRKLKISKRTKLEFELVSKTSEFTKYKGGKKQRRKSNYSQYCQWCGDKLRVTLNKSNKKMLGTKTVKVNLTERIFVCSKKCVDAARISLKRYGCLKPRTK